MVKIGGRMFFADEVQTFLNFLEEMTEGDLYLTKRGKKKFEDFLERRKRSLRSFHIRNGLPLDKFRREESSQTNQKEKGE